MKPELRAELIARMGVDQAVRQEVMVAWPSGTLIDTTHPLYLRWRQVDHDNTEWLRSVLEAEGWPGIGLVGKEGAHAAWLLAQHADDLEFQQSCLARLTAAVEAGEASPADLAYLVDRVAVRTGQPQVYGTQFEMRDGAAAPHTMVDPEGVDDRRQAVGLGPLAEYIAAINARE